MQFQVPQFIDIEDKIVGPFSLKQFGYLAAAALLIFILFFILKTALWIIVAIPIALFAAALALVKYNGRPLPYLILSIFRHFWRPRFYLWQHKRPAAPAPAITVPNIKLPKPVAKEVTMRMARKKEEARAAPPAPHPAPRPAPAPEPAGSPLSGELKTARPLEVRPPDSKESAPEAPRKSLLQMLGLKLAAYTHPIPRRERTPAPVALTAPQSEGIALLRRLMKERELARRVDYR